MSRIQLKLIANMGRVGLRRIPVRKQDAGVHPVRREFHDGVVGIPVVHDPASIRLLLERGDPEDAMGVTRAARDRHIEVASPRTVDIPPCHVERTSLRDHSGCSFGQ